jgi:hypothetical protein
MADLRCSACQSTGLEPGFLEDAGESSRGYLRWIPGALEKGIFGGAARMGKQRLDVSAYRCGECGHLDLYVDKTTT